MNAAAVADCVIILIITLLVPLSSIVCQTASNIQINECGVTEEESNNIVRKHNEYRKLIATGQVPNQPRGVDLKKMKWDDELAKQAENVAKTGIFKHTTIEDKRWTYVGQNLHLHTTGRNSSFRNWDRCLSSWFDEYKIYHYGPALIGDKAGHYTQMIWANSDHVGCGFCFYMNVSRTEMPFHKLYVCHYGPAGNFIGALPYTVGQNGCDNLC